MISSLTSSDLALYRKPCNEEVRNNTSVANERGYSYLAEGARDRNPYPAKNTGVAIQTRTIFWHSLIPFRGTYNSYQANEVKESRKVCVESVFEDTTVVTINNRHAAVLMGGCDAASDDQKMNEHFMNFFGELVTADLYQKLLESKRDLSLFAAVMVGTSCMLSTLMPPTLAGLSATYLAEKMLESVGAKGLFQIASKLVDVKGDNSPSLVKSTYIPIPLIGLDTAAMRNRALEIREQSEFNYVTKNCSWAVLECLKAGLPTKVVKKLPSVGLYTTPTDVKNTIAFLIENEYVISGEVDKDGVAWFDARTDLD